MSSSGVGAAPDARALPGRRVLLLGLDGASWGFLEAPAVSEAMPALRSLLGGCGTGVLASTVPPYTGPAWTSITTGVNPGRHGVFGFTDASGRPVSDARVEAPRLWDYVGRAGGRSVVLNVPITHPPRPIDGVLVSGMPVPPSSAFTCPEGLAAELERVTGGYVTDVPVRTGGREGRATLARLERMTAARGGAAAALARREEWDLMTVVFVLPDRLGHPWWKHLVPGDAHYETRRGARVRAAASGCLRALDRAVEGLMSALPAGTEVVVCSDHGFGPLRAEVFFDLALASAGLIDAGPGRLSSRLFALGHSRAGKLVPAAVRDRARRATSRPGRRRAWTGPPYEGAVHVADESVLEPVRELLAGLRDHQGKPAVRSIRTREELYDGPFVHRAPELYPELAREDVDLHDGLHAPAAWVSREGLAWGTHTRDGVAALTAVPAGTKVEGSCPDIAATVLGLLGVEVPGLDGGSLVPTAGVKLGVDATPPNRSASEDVYGPEDERAVLDHLRGLGYVD